MHLNLISNKNLQILITESLNFKKGDVWYNPLTNTNFSQAPSNVLTRVCENIDWKNLIPNYYSKYKLPSFSKMRYEYGVDGHKNKIIINNILFSYANGYTYTIITETYFLDHKETLLKLLQDYQEGALIARRLYKVKLPEYQPPITHL